MSGESQRHIDWRAVARGQPLMTKQFTAESETVVYLDFSPLHFADMEESLSQLALWVIEAERAQRPYGLRLPATEIPPSLGNAFSSVFACTRLFEFKEQEHDKTKSGGQRDMSIPRRPLLWLVAALLFTLPAIFGPVGWVPIVFLVALTVKFWMEPKGHRLRSQHWNSARTCGALRHLRQLRLDQRSRARRVDPSPIDVGQNSRSPHCA